MISPLQIEVGGTSIGLSGMDIEVQVGGGGPRDLPIVEAAAKGRISHPDALGPVYSRSLRC